MVLLLVYSIVLLLAVLISSRAERSVLSTSVLFLAGGFLCGPGVLNLFDITVDHPAVGQLAEFALVAVLFSDGMRLGLRDLKGVWHLPGRALLFGMPLTLALTALLARWLTSLDWVECWLLGAALSPTDPVFAAAIVGRERVPYRLRQLLNVESGLNDGLALPVVLILLGRHGPDFGLVTIGGDVLGGIALGVVIPWLALWLEETPFFASIPEYKPLNAIAICLIVFSTALLTGTNEFLATFAAGFVVATRSPAVKEEFHRFGELLADILKFAALLVFGAVISPRFLAEIPLSGYVFALLVLFAVRPISLAIALIGSQLDWKEWTVAAWFGPKGFASVVYGLLILKQAGPQGDRMFHLIAIAIAASILAHSSTDVIAADWFGIPEQDEQHAEQQAAAPPESCLSSEDRL